MWTFLWILIQRIIRERAEVREDDVSIFFFTIFQLLNIFAKVIFFFLSFFLTYKKNC